MIEKIRNDFEEWVISNGGDVRLNGEYVSNVTECAWQAWVACADKSISEIAELKESIRQLEYEVMEAIERCS